MKIKFRVFVLIIIPLLALLVQNPAFAVPVDPLPEDNLVVNPWFRDGSRPSFDGWTEESQVGNFWSLSQKDSNPSPDSVVGTSARLADGHGQGGFGVGSGGVDAVLTQVVATDPAHRGLAFKVHWVTGWINTAVITIHGGTGANGPWTPVWIPLQVNAANTSHHAWTQTELQTTVIEAGFSHYKLEILGNYPVGTTQGFKLTGVYFATNESDAPAAELQVNIPAPLVVTDPPRLRATATAVSSLTLTAEAQDNPAIVATEPPPPTAPPTQTPPPVEDPQTSEPTAEPASVAAVNTPLSPTTAAEPGFVPPVDGGDGSNTLLYGIIAVLGGLVLFLGAGWWQQSRKNTD